MLVQRSLLFLGNLFFRLLRCVLLFLFLWRWLVLRDWLIRWRIVRLLLVRIDHVVVLTRVVSA